MSETPQPEQTQQTSEDVAPAMSIDLAAEIVDRAIAFVNGLPEVGQPRPETLAELITQVAQVEDFVMRASLFSENEPLEEVLPENFRYLSLPFIQGVLHQKVMENRLASLKKCKGFFFGFINFMNHYEVSPGFIRDQAKKFEEGKGKFEMPRSAKIMLNKYRALAEDRAKTNTEKFARGDIKPLEFHRSVLVFQLYESIRELSFLDREMEILEFRKKMEQDPELKEQWEQEKAAKPPKPKYWKVMGPDKPAEVITLESIRERQREAYIKMHSKPIDIGGHNEMKDKTDVLNTLWQPDHAQPNMTLEEHGELEYTLMVEKSKLAHENEERKERELARLTSDEREELERLKASAWDDWKDDHEKGAGNKMKGR